MGRSKIRVAELGEMLRVGKDTNEIARYFGVTPRAVQKRAKQLAESVTDHAVRHAGKEILRQDLDARAQLLKINDSANRVLDLLEEQLQQDRQEGVSRLVARVLSLKAFEGEPPEEVEAIIEEIEALVVSRPATIEQLFKAQAEIRQQVALLVKVAAELLEANRVNEVHRIMLEEIGVESPQCQSRIVRRLKGSNLLLTAVGWS